MKWLKNVEKRLRVRYEAFLYFWGLFLASRERIIADSRAAGRTMIIGQLLGLILGLYVAGATLPDSITFLTNATKWANTPAAVQTLGTTVLGLVAVVVFIYMLLRTAGLTGD